MINPVIKPLCYSDSDIQVYSGDLYNYESYSSLKCLLCISAALDCVEIV